jgi:uncharacterized protein DUF7009
MKIRIKGNSIRVRLTRSEVDNFGKTGYLEELTEFGSNTFIYALRSVPEGNQLSAAFDASKIIVTVPDSITREWTSTDKVGFDNHMDIGNGKQLFLLIEKDFKCIDAPSNEDQSDNYEHPTMSCA